MELLEDKVEYKIYHCQKEDFSSKGIDIFKKVSAVYILKNEDTIYIGQTDTPNTRMKKHIKTKDFIEDIYIITSDVHFNKAVILDLEDLLVKNIIASGQYIIDNEQNTTERPNYRRQEQVRGQLFPRIWKSLCGIGVVEGELEELQNSFISKYFPADLKELTPQQSGYIDEILTKVSEEEVVKYLIQGDPGTGKTVVLTELVKALVERGGINQTDIAVIIPQGHLKESFGKLFKYSSLENISVYSPTSYLNRGRVHKFVLIDESHRLKYYHPREAYTQGHLIIDGVAENELKLILSLAENAVLFYDQYQTIRPADINTESFEELTHTFEKKELTVQFRLKNQHFYLPWLRKVLQLQESSKQYKGVLDEYDFRIVDSLADLHSLIVEKESEVGLCRIVSGYSRPWKSKKNKDEYDFVEDGIKLKWNLRQSSWVYNSDASNEIGCIHTIQGSDLNYVGVIIGRDLTIDLESGKLKVNRKQYFDVKGSTLPGDDIDDTELLEYIKRIYYVLLSRGIYGCYVLIEDKHLRDYIIKQIQLTKEIKTLI
ncbi:DNA/RNA helicase domain-containing protein [Bacillus toyonensis]|uniref:DNA/RNA helicase domain-containing protein n=2 Tax=Bacillus toyonensis TaxID=155322 RepID=UPI000BEFD345|nr:DNA/RNA helicase domain-containing protein [Bacillus toyonensis]PEJ83393.1 hypothetical protein CN687_28450 [Bacillus toyonensis]PEL00208.1 hypothetical protein CN614_30055 [Bacillus toyonensis]PEP04009.1 hypothetical protein CN577_24490 [Bacillus toyonensis]PEU32851.1 hypothetical protein CN537_30625 [Bacillus toyonensis]PGC94252.1 hypothetical protein COM26_22925 [Bacillus toyonensis]